MLNYAVILILLDRQIYFLRITGLQNDVRYTKIYKTQRTIFANENKGQDWRVECERSKEFKMQAVLYTLIRLP